MKKAELTAIRASNQERFDSSRGGEEVVYDDLADGVLVEELIGLRKSRTKKMKRIRSIAVNCVSIIQAKKDGQIGDIDIEP
jgi:hypothetical protein